MNKTMILLVSISSAFYLTACATNAEEKQALYERNGTTVNVTDRNDLYNETNLRNDREPTRYGYVRHQKNPIPGKDTTYDQMAKLDKEQAADVIGKLCTQLPNVSDVATLVTDEEVLIAYQTESDDRDLTAEQVKRTATSVVPGYYDIIVADNLEISKEIERYGALDASNSRIDQSLKETIKKMLTYPQGTDFNSNKLTTPNMMSK
ncbi:YhcN/YlaJ family sporulation lipoprotein [Cytobacillus sp. IB215665]|uniref:YhcN/YlaJ family sporulation lipoprotein n=1 Tax=Cytobacillus sp. IB215665 TaxID=3097357 RepID=UPI002A140F45|nr:YhcN/YlaJ family sporulation lipoprotein [Cytobacillus sp. IB215665]MDX8365941.1 YhcN/YlaJ family sporulation lipoprotein [Cytobacillus sp. IB215665]